MNSVNIELSQHGVIVRFYGASPDPQAIADYPSLEVACADIQTWLRQEPGKPFQSISGFTYVEPSWTVRLPDLRFPDGLWNGVQTDEGAKR